MLESRNLELQEEMIKRYEWLFNHPHLHELSCLPIAGLSSCKAPIYIIEITFLRDSSNYTQFSYILNALAAFEQTIGCIIISKNNSLSLYFGLKGNCPAALSLLERGLLQFFPGSTFMRIDDIGHFLKTLFDPSKYSYVTSALAMPNESYTQPLLPSFIDLMGKQEDFVAFFLAQPICRNDILCSLNEFYEIHNILAQFSQTTYTNYKSDSKTSSNATANCCTNTCSESTTNTCTENHSTSKNCYSNLSFSTPFSLIAHRPSNVTETTPREAKVPSNAASPNSNEKKSESNNSSFGSSVIVTNTPTTKTTTTEASKSINTTLLLNRANGSGSSNGSSTAHADSCGNSTSTTNTRNHSLCQTSYHALSFSSPNQYIQDAVSNLIEAITRYTALSKNKAYCFSSYFFSKRPDISMRAAYSYLGLLDNSSIFSPNIVSSWSCESPQFKSIFKSLKHFSHPSFCLSDNMGCVTNTVPILSTELINTLYLPISNAIP